MELSVLHYHFRPGGVRRVIELGLPALARATGCPRVTLAAGEAPSPDWRELMERALHPCAVTWCIEPALGYWSEQQRPAEEVRAALQRMLTPRTTLWAHNLSVGRNMILAREIAALPDTTPLWLHHHDWWWDGRWERWPEMQAQGIASLEEALGITLPRGENVRHLSINATDARRLRQWTGVPVHFLANPVLLPRVSQEEAEAARAFLKWRTSADSHWLYPCRGLRRKNLAEALLVQQCMAPEAVTVTTGAASSAAEEPYFSALTAAAEQNGWPLFAGVCAPGDAPPVPHLIAAADAVVVTSLREGFGLPYYEAAGKPLAARIPAGLAETMEHTGFQFQNGWQQLAVPDDCFDSAREHDRVAARRSALALLLPRELHPQLLETPAGGSVDFGCLTLAAQLDVLRQPAHKLRHSLRELNPVLRRPLLPQPPAAQIQPPDAWAQALLAMTQQAAPPRTRTMPPDFASGLPGDWLRHPLRW